MRYPQRAAQTWVISKNEMGWKHWDVIILDERGDERHFGFPEVPTAREVVETIEANLFRYI
jgi:hypothetical protein